MLARALVAAAVVSLFALPALAQTGQAELAAQDLQFAQEAAIGGLKEVTLGELAQEQAKDEQVVQFGERMVQDHSMTNEKLMTIAEEKGLELPQELPEDAQQKYQELQELSDAEFDQAYMEEMVKDHEETVDLFEQQAESGEAPDLRAFAEETLPALREHLQMAEQIQSELSAAMEETDDLEQTQAAIISAAARME